MAKPTSKQNEQQQASLQAGAELARQQPDGGGRWPTINPNPSKRCSQP